MNEVKLRAADMEARLRAAAKILATGAIRVAAAELAQKATPGVLDRSDSADRRKI